jgi:arylsulfatase
LKSSVASLATWMLLLSAAPVAARPPSFVIFLADDLGFSDLSSYGGELATPAIDGIGQQGFRFRQFYATPRCSPTRAALLTGHEPHEAGMGHLADMRTDHPAYQGQLRADVPTLPERLRPVGYRSYMVGKWHLDFRNDPASPSAPIARGFDRFYGVLRGAEDYYRPRSLSRDAQRLPEPSGDFYLTDRLAEEAAVYLRDHAVQTPDQPFFLYVAFTAPHWPVQAPPADLSRAAGLYDQGWDRVREARAPRLRGRRVLRGDWQAAPRDAAVPPWEDADHPNWQRARMEAYVGALHALDRGVATVLAALRETGREDDTVVAFLSDNGGSPEELSRASLWLREAAGLFTWEHYGDDPSKSPGPPDSFQSYGRAWSNVSNSPFHGHKAGLYEGGIASPLLISLPTRTGGVGRPLDSWVDQAAHVTDLSATILDMAGATPLPEAMAGESLVPLLEGRPWDRSPIFWEHEGWRAVREGDLKAVAPFGGLSGGNWELYDLASDRTERHDLAGERRADLVRLTALHDAWAERVGVQSWPWVLPFARQAAYGVASVGVLVLVVGLLLLWRRLSRS